MSKVKADNLMDDFKMKRVPWIDKISQRKVEEYQSGIYFITTVYPSASNACEFTYVVEGQHIWRALRNWFSVDRGEFVVSVRKMEGKTMKKKLYLFLLTQDVNQNYDTYDSCIVVAENMEKARQINPSGRWDSSFPTWAFTPDEVKVTKIGEAEPGIEKTFKNLPQGSENVATEFPIISATFVSG